LRGTCARAVCRRRPFGYVWFGSGDDGDTAGVSRRGDLLSAGRAKSAGNLATLSPKLKSGQTSEQTIGLLILEEYYAFYGRLSPAGKSGETGDPGGALRTGMAARRFR